MYLIELSDYCLNATGSGNGLKNSYFTLSNGDICSIQTDSSDDAHNFIKALATLIYPVNGAYRFLGEAANFSENSTLIHPGEFKMDELRKIYITWRVELELFNVVPGIEGLKERFDVVRPTTAFSISCPFNADLI